MRLIAVVPAVLCMVALILSFLCLFAGSKKNFMEDYAIVTLNTSRIGTNLSESFFDSVLDRRQILDDISSATAEIGSLATGTATKTDTSSSDSPNAIESLASEATAAIGDGADDLADDIGDEFDDAVNAVAKALGLHDFYSAHILDFCEGYYVPGPMVNETVEKGSIHKNVTSCSNKTAMYSFDPRTTLSEEIANNTDGKVDLSDINWPDEINDGIAALQMAFQGTFVCYCLSIGLIFLGMIGAVVGLFTNGRLGPLVNGMISGLAFLASLIASGLVTTIAVKATHVINKYGYVISIRATRGNKFLALTWCATGLVFVSGCVWLFEFVRAWRQRPQRLNEPKYG